MRGSEPRASDPRARADALLRRLEGMALVHAVPRGPRGSTAFFIDRFEVTSDQFAAFARAAEYRPREPSGYLAAFADAEACEPRRELGKHPVVFVDAEDAEAYAAWQGKSLPTEEEWRTAASGEAGRSVTLQSGPASPRDRRYAMNALETELGGTAPVGTFEGGRTRNLSVVAPAVYDLFGNVAEWTSSADAHGLVRTVLGGSFNESAASIGAGLAAYEEDGGRNFALGFRCVLRDARGVVEELLALLPQLDDGRHERVLERLFDFGAPLENLLEQIRFDAAVLHVFPGLGGGENDRCVALSDGRAALCTASGTLALLDTREGRVLWRQSGLGAVHQLASADLDRDGQLELYVGCEGSARALPEYLVCTPAPGQGSLVDPATSLPVALLGADLDNPWRTGLAFRPEDIEAVFQEPWFAGDLAAQEQPFGAPIGVVLTNGERLVRFDVRGGELRERWSCGGVRARDLVLLPAAGMLALAGPRSITFHDGLRELEGVGEIALLGAGDGSILARGLTAGGITALAQLSADPLRLAVASSTGGAYVVERRGARFAASAAAGAAGAWAVVDAVAGPGPDAATLLCIQDGECAELRSLDASGGLARVRPFQVRGAYTPRLLAAPSQDALFLVTSTGDLARLDAELERVWTAADIAPVDPDRAPPAELQFDHRAGAELAVAHRSDGVALLDLASGRAVDARVDPRTSWLLVVPVRQRGGDRLLVVRRDAGVAVLRPPYSALDRTAGEVARSLRAPRRTR